MGPLSSVTSKPRPQESRPPEDLSNQLPPGIGAIRVEIHPEGGSGVSCGATWDGGRPDGRGRNRIRSRPLGRQIMNPSRASVEPRGVGTDLPPERNLRVNTISLILSHLLTGVLGLVFWGAAARLFPAEEVGTAAAVITSAVMLSTISILSIDALYERFLPQAGTHAGPLLKQGFLLVAATALLLGAGLVVFGPSYALFDAGWAMACYPLLVMVLAVFTLQDKATVGLGVARWSAAKNSFHAVAKLVLLLVLALVWTDRAVSIVVAWGATAASGGAVRSGCGTPPVPFESPIPGTAEPAISRSALVVLPFVIRDHRGLGRRASHRADDRRHPDRCQRRTRISLSPGRSSARYTSWCTSSSVRMWRRSPPTRTRSLH